MNALAELALHLVPAETEPTATAEERERAVRRWFDQDRRRMGPDYLTERACSLDERDRLAAEHRLDELRAAAAESVPIGAELGKILEAWARDHRRIIVEIESRAENRAAGGVR